MNWFQILHAKISSSLESMSLDAARLFFVNWRNLSLIVGSFVMILLISRVLLTQNFKSNYSFYSIHGFNLLVYCQLAQSFLSWSIRTTPDYLHSWQSAARSARSFGLSFEIFGENIDQGHEKHTSQTIRQLVLHKKAPLWLVKHCSLHASFSFFSRLWLKADAFSTKFFKLLVIFCCKCSCLMYWP